MFVLVICGFASCFSVPQLGDAFKEILRFCVIKITMRLKKMALRLHIDKNIGDAFITFYVAFIRRLRCVYEEKKLVLRL